MAGAGAGDAATAAAESADSATRTPAAGDVAALLAAALVECVLLALLVRHSIGTAAFVIAHLGVVLALGMLLASRRHAADQTMLAMAALATLSVGPLGALGALCVVLLAPVRSGTTPLLTAWYERIAHSVQTDPVSQLCDMVSIGRSVDLSGPQPASFCAVMSHGSLGERQALLGLIARNFDVEYLPALRLALTSPEPVIRVQAAAVATKVQLALARIVRAWAKRVAPDDSARIDSTGIDAIDALGGIVELQACLGSGLIEANDRASAERSLARIRADVGKATAAPGFKYTLLAARANPHQLPAISAYDHLMVAERRFRELRNWRRLQRPGRLPQYRLRPSACRRKSHPAQSLEGVA